MVHNWFYPMYQSGLNSDNGTIGLDSSSENTSVIWWIENSALTFGDLDHENNILKISFWFFIKIKFCFYTRKFWLCIFLSCLFVYLGKFSCCLNYIMEIWKLKIDWFILPLSFQYSIIIFERNSSLSIHGYGETCTCCTILGCCISLWPFQLL